MGLQPWLWQVVGGSHTGGQASENSSQISGHVYPVPASDEFYSVAAAEAASRGMSVLFLQAVPL